MDIAANSFVMALSTGSQNAELFPFPFGLHLTFALIGIVFFAFRFTTHKRPYQLIMALNMLVSLGVWLSDSKTVYYAVGIIEVLLLIAALVTSFIFKEKPAETSAAESSEEEGKEDAE